MSGCSPKYSPAFFTVLVIGVVLGGANLIMGDLNQDEGWYLYAAQSVADGKLPYRDFAFTQGPMQPIVYSLISPVIDAFGVAGGRAFTWLLGLATALMAAGMAKRLGGASAGVVTFALVAVNVYQSYFTTVVKTYSLCAFFMIAGFCALAKFIDLRKSWWLALAGVGLAAAAGTRLSSGIVLPLVGIWLLAQPGRWGKLGWLWFGIGGGAALLLIFLPLYMAAPEGFMFGLVEYHTMRDSGSVLSSLVLKAGFISRLVQFYFVATALLLLLFAVKLWRPFKGQDTGYHQSSPFFLVRLLWVSVFAVTFVHIMAPFPYDDYQVPVFPVLAVALGTSWSYAIRAWSSEPFRWQEHVTPGDPAKMKWFVWVIVLVSAASSFSSPINMDWMIAGRDRIWWKMKEQPSLLQLREVAREMRTAYDGELILTQDTYLAVEAGMRVPQGWEMGPFSYYPEMSDEQAAMLHLVNRKKMFDDLALQPAAVAAFSGYGLSIASPQVTEIDDEEKAALENALSRNYTLEKEVPGFGQAGTRLRIFSRNDVTRGNP